MQDDVGKRLPEILYGLCLSNSEGTAAYKTLIKFEELLSAGRFDVVDGVINEIDVDRLLLSPLMCVVSITYHAKLELKNRDNFISKVETSLIRRVGADRAAGLLRNRR